MWQEIIVFGCVALAFMFILRRYWSTATWSRQRHKGDVKLPVTLQHQSACGSCRACGSGRCH